MRSIVWCVMAVASLTFMAPGLLAADLPGTRVLAEGETPGEGRIEELSWLAGLWAGEGIGGLPAYESYSPPSGGQIVGHFTQAGTDGPRFHELITIIQDGASISVRLKHFDADLRGWETPDAAAAVEFPLIAREGDTWYFSGLTIRRDGPDAMSAAVRIDTTGEELVFRYRRGP